MIKSLLMFIGVLLVIGGILGLVPSIGWFRSTPWIAWGEIAFGTIIVLTSNTKEKE